MSVSSAGGGVEGGTGPALGRGDSVTGPSSPEVALSVCGLCWCLLLLGIVGVVRVVVGFAALGGGRGCLHNDVMGIGYGLIEGHGLDYTGG